MRRGKTAPRLILASGSPRRRRLLLGAGFRFEVVRSDVEERFDAQLTLGELTIWNAIRKGRSAACASPEAVVLAADTLVAFKGKVIGKPSDMEEALRILRRLNGRTHEVCTGVFVGRRADAEFRVFREMSRVKFRRMTVQGLRDYLRSVSPLDKAGAYAAQKEGGQIIARIEGSRTNVIGLPMRRTLEALRSFGISPSSG